METSLKSSPLASCCPQGFITVGRWETHTYSLAHTLVICYLFRYPACPSIFSRCRDLFTWLYHWLSGPVSDDKSAERVAVLCGIAEQIACKG